MGFKAEVTSKPAGVAKGQFEAEFTPKGLALHPVKKGEPLTIPIQGANYNGKGWVDVPYQNGTLTFRPLGLTLDNNALAEEIAEFLCGRRAAPNVADFKVPGWLIAMAGLPLLIPASTLGGGIPGAIGGTLAFSCLLLAKKREMPSIVRALLIILITTIGFVGTYTLLVVLFSMRPQ